MRQLSLIWLAALLVSLIQPAKLSADEGMWLPLFLQSLNESDMQALGMRITAEDIYSVNQGSLKDAIVHFGGFCTGEIISDQGLLLTNHHCGYGQIQYHSSLENNYLEDGFWAMSQEEELPNEGLFVEFIIRIEDVTEAALAGVDADKVGPDRQALIDRNLNNIRESVEKEDYQGVKIRPFFGGNQYFLFVTERYTDVRLVGAPPSSIGKFGADTDNWEWPRHTGDFSLFRVYSGPDGKPAPYSTDNIPLRPRHHLPINLNGIEPGDFTMVFGFPGRTDQHLSSEAMRNRVLEINPIRVGMRDSSLSVIDRYMRQDAEIKIQYASRQARIANAWKKWRGETEGVIATRGIERRQELEDEMERRVVNNKDEWYMHVDALTDLTNIARRQLPYARSNAYVGELNYNIDLFRLANYAGRLISRMDNNGEAGLREVVPRAEAYLSGFYSNYRPEVDRAVAAKLLPIYFDKVEDGHQSPQAKAQLEFAGDVSTLVATLFENSFLTDGERLLSLLSSDPAALIRQLKGDPAIQFVSQLNGDHERLVLSELRPLQEQETAAQRQHIASMMAVFPGRTFWPDANGTMRVSYGRAEGYVDGENIDQHYMTYLSGVIDKYQPGDYEFDLPAALIQLYEEKDYGRYATEDGRMPVCFLGSNHTSGGNSGSPAIDADGQLVGLNFDRVWEGTMSDINYDRSICRNIMVDIRYVLFLTEKLGGAGHLIEEMTLVE
ncbi:MAG: S46 family peptidase [Bacteroidota bacterium]